MYYERLVRMFVFAAVLAAFCLTTSAAVPDEPVPAWLTRATMATAPSYEGNVPAVVLYSEQISSFSGGKLVTTENYAVRVLTREGRTFAKAAVYYLTSATKVRDFNAWMIRRDGTSRSYDKRMVVDVIADSDDVYNEGRLKTIDATGDADVGIVFGYSATTEESPLFYQDRWEFQGRLPTLVSRYTLNLPSGWTASSITFNTDEVKPEVRGSSYTWEMTGLQPIRPEPMSPSVVNMSPRIVISYGPTDRSQLGAKMFTDWVDVSRWTSSLHDSQVIVDDNVAAKARELTAGAKSELEQIRAVARFVQGLQYISIDIGIAHGNGYVPRPSTLVLSRGYGDCKDKANLMRAMLKALKIEAYPIAVYSGDPSFVKADWASPRQFNHCIIAVKVSDATKAPTVMDHDKLGRLLIFDATDPFTQVGDLPYYLQGSYGLIGAGDNGGLAKLPVTPQGTDLLDRRIEAAISPTGGVSGKIVELANGQVSATFRREMRMMSNADYRKMIEGWLASGSVGSALVDLKMSDDPDLSKFELGVEFRSDRYAQLMQGRMLVFKPVIVGRRQGFSLTELKRSAPIQMSANAIRERSLFTLPAGFVVDEVPDAVTIDTQFGRYTTSYEIKDDTLIFSRSFETFRKTIPAEQYDEVRKFYSRVRDAENAPVVLVRK